MRKTCVALLLAALMALAGAAWGATPKTVYLKDGGRIEAQSVWRKGDIVYVLVNRDTLVELPQDEVNLKKTFAAAKKAATKKKAAPKPGAVKPAEAGTAATGAAAKEAAAPAAKPAPGAPPAKAETPAAAKPGTPAATPAPPTPGAAPEAAKAVEQQGAKPGEQPAPPQAAPEAPKPVPPVPQATPEPPPAPPEMPAAGMGMALAAMGMVPLLIFGLLLLFFIATFWKIFEKAGEAGWKSLIPIYNVFVMLKIAGKPWWWFFLFLVPLVNIIINLLWCLALAQKFGKSQLFGVGLFFLGIIFFPILAFDKSTYQG